MTNNDFLSILKCTLSDATAFPLVQLLFLALVWYAIIQERGWFRRNTGLSMAVKRGEESWGNFYLIYGLLAVMFVEVNSTAEALKGYKTIITMADLVALFYLCFFNGWFRNKIIGIISASKNMEEKC